MATPPMPNPAGGQGVPPPGPGAPPPSPDQGGQPTDPSSQDQSSFQAPANDIQILLAKWSQVAQQMAASDPRLAAGAEKVREGIRDMQTALITPQQPTPTWQQPQ